MYSFELNGGPRYAGVRENFSKNAYDDGKSIGFLELCNIAWSD